MINKTCTKKFGSDALEINFYISENIKATDKIRYIAIPQGVNIKDLDEKVAIYFQDIYGALMLIDSINKISDSIHKCHTQLTSPQKDHSAPLGAILPNLSSNYYIGTHNLINNIHRLFLFIVHLQNTINRLNINIDYLFPLKSIESARKNNQAVESLIYQKIFNHDKNLIEFIEIIEDLNMIYRSPNMFTNTRIFSPTIPAICALAPINDEQYKLIFHNHSLHQIMHCFYIFAENNFPFLTKDR